MFDINGIDFCKYMLILNLIPAECFKQKVQQSNGEVLECCLEHFTGKQVNR